MKGKWLNMWIIGVVAAIVLAGCSGSGAKNASSESEEDGVVTLNFHHWIKEDVGHWEEIIATFEEEHPDIKVESIPLVDNMTNEDYLKKLDLLASSGEQLDVMMFANSQHLAKRVNAGLVAPLDSFMKEEGIDIEEEYNNTYPEIDGSYYALPGKLNTSLVLLNKDHLDAAGLEIPTEWTWDDYKKYAKELTTSDHFGSYLHTWPAVYHVLKLMGAPENQAIIKSDGSSNMGNPLVKESLQLRYDLEQVDKSSVPLAQTLSQKLDYRQQFFSQSASMIPTSSYMVTEWGEFTPDFTMAWAPWPKNSKNEEGNTVINGDGFSVAESSDHKEEAYEFIRWMTTEGIMQQEIWIPSWQNAELDNVLDKLVSKTTRPVAVDLDSLTHTLESAVPGKPNVPNGYSTEAETEYNAVVELYLLGKQDLDTTMKQAKKKVQDIVDANKD